MKAILWKDLLFVASECQQQRTQAMPKFQAEMRCQVKSGTFLHAQHKETTPWHCHELLHRRCCALDVPGPGLLLADVLDLPRLYESALSARSVMCLVFIRSYHGCDNV